MWKLSFRASLIDTCKCQYFRQYSFNKARGCYSFDKVVSSCNFLALWLGSIAHRARCQLFREDTWNSYNLLKHHQLLTMLGSSENNMQDFEIKRFLR